MRLVEPADAVPKEDSPENISLRDILRWIARWWWLILLSGVTGALFGLISHLTFEERFTVRLGMTVLDSPLGTPALIRNISTNVLRGHVGPTVAVGLDRRTGALSLTEKGVPKDGIAVRQASMRNAAAALRSVLDGAVTGEYALLQKRSRTVLPDAGTYARIDRLRFYADALNDGLIESVVAGDGSVRPQRPSLPVLLLLGAVGGGCLGAAAAFAVEALWRRRRA